MNKPQIRFRGFTGEWDSVSFEKLANYKKGPFGSMLKKEIFVPKGDGSIKVYEQQNAINKNWALSRYFISKEYATFLNGFRVYGGDIIVSCAGTIGEVYELPKNATEGVINQALMRVRVNKKITSVYLFIVVFSNMIDTFSKTYSNGSAIKNIPPFSDLKSACALIPQLPEQTKIGNFFKNIDRLLSQEEKKHAKLINMKKALLEKMFPQKGENVPQVRFKGFDKEWERKELNDCIETIQYGLNAPATIYDGKNKYLRITDIDDESRTFNYTNLTSPDTSLSNAENYKLKVGDILFARTGASVGKTYRYSDCDEIVYFAGFLIRARVKKSVSYEIVFQYTLSQEYNNFITIKSQRSGQPGVNAQEYGELLIPIPSFLEQTKIGELFKKLDKRIELQQAKIKKLKNMKKALLDTMFV